MAFTLLVFITLLNFLLAVVTESARACSYILSKQVQKNMLILAVNALAVNVLAVDSVLQAVSHTF